MSKKQPNTNQPGYTAADFADPLGWMRRQTYGDLKNWLRQAVWNGKFLPVIIPPINVPPILYLVQLLLRNDTEVRTAMRTIIPELLREWNVRDTRDCLLSLLLLCSNLSCNEAESTVATIITEKLRDEPEDIKCRKEALGVLQTIGTERTIHLFKRYISNPEYAAYCYRGLYRFDLTYAGTELPRLMKMYRGKEGQKKLKAILHFLFIVTLKPSQYYTVVQSFLENAPGQYFLDFFDFLGSLGIFESFFENLSKAESTKLLGQVIKQTPLEHSTLVVELLQTADIEIEPPAESYNPEPDTIDAIAVPPVPLIGGGTHFTYRRISGKGDIVPVVAREELSTERQWAFARNYNPAGLDHMFAGH
jgi:hypothetical protein